MRRKLTEEEKRRYERDTVAEFLRSNPHAKVVSVEVEDTTDESGMPKVVIELDTRPASACASKR